MSEQLLYVAFVWNQHQPFYRDAVSGELIMPWVRLHACKDYYQMAAILESYPKVRQTFNLTPSLLEQFECYLAGEEDYYQKVNKPAEKLNDSEKQYLLHHYFDIHWDKVIRQYPRYQELLELQGWSREPEAVRAAMERYRPQDYRDLQVWFNLAWIDPQIRQSDPLLSGLVEKGRNFTEAERRSVMKRQRDLVGGVVPLHRRLQERGQIEIMTTPYYHPIIPLLIDSCSALRASPGLPLPRRFQYPQDACEQLAMARVQYQRLFGKLPQGIWPSEMAVSPETVALFATYGFDWSISDEQILARSLNAEIIRDGYGHVLNGDLLYQPYRVRGAGGEIAMVFRDHHLSNRIGFEYQHFRPEDAAADLVHRLQKIRENLSWSPGNHLVTLSLDGENAWEWYQGDKGPFLHSLYRRLSEEPLLRCCTVSDYLAANPPQRIIDNLFTGSWVDHNLTRWIGTENKNLLWDYLLEAREAVEHYRQSNSCQPERLKEALHYIYIAEGSDFPWWIDSMPYYLAAPFEALFRRHLVAVYRSLKRAVPDYLRHPLIHPQPGESAFYNDPLAGPISMVPSNSDPE
ncbi:MAG: glycoside hydrolase family 57 protein [Dethiobacteria bacterium]|jgi:alpha-amylase/alpha-mannosidase (GH57 family)